MAVFLQTTTEQGLSDSETALLVAAVGAGVTILLALFGALVSFTHARSDRRRGVYSEATRSALAWTELLYRVRRRETGKEHDLIDKFHDAQEDLSFYTAWIGSDSVFVQRSFTRLVNAVKSETEPLIQAAWKEGPRKPPGDALPDDQHPNVTAAQNTFLKDVRAHLSVWPWSRLAVAWRNRDSV